jgi:PAS domain S-box-containing protein
MLFCLLYPAVGFAESDGSIVLTKAEKDWIAENHTVRVRVADWPPFQFNDDGFKGITVDYVEKIFNTHGIEYEFVSASEIPWDKALEYIRDHKDIDLILAVVITDERKKDMLFSSEYISYPNVIFTRVDAPFIGGLEDLSGKIVSVPENFIMHRLLRDNYPEIRLRTVSRASAVEYCLELLAKGQVDAYVGSLTVGSYIIMNRAYGNLKVAAPTPFESHNEAMAIRDDWPELVGIIDKTLASFSREEHTRIRNRWMSVRYEYGLHYMDILKWVLAVTLFFSVVILLYTLWNRKLKSEIEARKIVEKQLQSSERRYKGLSEAAFEGILIAVEGEISDANKALLDMFGYTREELMGMSVEILIHPDVRERFNSELLGKQDSYEINTISREGRKFPVAVQIKRYVRNEKHVSIVAVRDLTETHKAAEEIKNLQAILPICSRCRQIRDDKGYWSGLEEYLSEHNIADFSHSLCPECARKLYPDLKMDGSGTPDSSD